LAQSTEGGKTAGSCDIEADDVDVNEGVTERWCLREGLGGNEAHVECGEKRLEGVKGSGVISERSNLQLALGT